MNEFDLIAKLRDRIGPAGERVAVGSGDDAAVVRPGGGVSATSIDAFVEGVHFRLATTSLHDLGHKCLAAALSDIAAMGAEPGEAYLAVGMPPGFGEREALELVAGAQALAQRCGVAICGGDVTRSSELVVVVAVVGYAGAAGDLVTRAGAHVDDAVGVTGTLGGAAAGLLLLERKHGGIDVDVGERLLARQLRPRPLLSAGRLLAQAGARAMIDVSDGIASDVERICERSGVGADVELARLPLDEGVAEVCDREGIDPLELAATGGEDYELLVTAAEGDRAALERAAAAAGTSLTWIGGTRGAGAEPVRLLDAAGRVRRLRGWDHLRAAPTRFPGRA